MSKLNEYKKALAKIEKNQNDRIGILGKLLGVGIGGVGGGAVAAVTGQTALFTLSANIQRILKEYKNIYQMFFTISFDMLRIVFVTLADLKKCNINTATQHQLLHKTVKDFLKVAKDTLDEIEGPLRFDQESTYYVMAKPDIDIWKKIAGGFDKLERDLFNITNKMVR